MLPLMATSINLKHSAMKNLLYITIFCVTSTLSFSQNVSIMNGNDGNPAIITMRFPDTTYVHDIKDGKIPDHVVMGDSYLVSPNELFEHGDNSNHSNNRVSMDTIEPGVLPEADLPYKMKYSVDGTKLMVLYYHTNNLYVYDVGTLETLAVVYVGEGSIDMEVTKEHIYVCCYYSDDIYVINSDDYSIEDIFTVDHQPCVFEVNSDETIIYVGFDNGEHWKEGGFIAAYDLSSYEQLFKTYWPYISEMHMFGGWIGRQHYSYTDLLLIGNDNYIATLRNGGNVAIIINALSGELEESFIFPYTSGFATTASKDSLYLFAQKDDSLYYYCIDSYNHNVVNSISFSKTGNPAFWTWEEIAVSNDGSKLFMEIGSITTSSYGYMIDFANNDHKIFGLNQYDNEYHKLLSCDGRYVIIPGTKLKIFDFETEDYVYDQFFSSWSTGMVTAISPNSYNFVMSEYNGNYYNTYTTKDEYIDFYNFSDPANIIKTSSIFCGQEPEADLSYSATLNNHHNKIVTGNPLSGNISIIDATTYEIDTIIDIEHISVVKNINDDLVVLSGYSSPYLLLFDLSTLSVVKQFDIDYFYIIIPSPDKQYVYAYSRYEGSLAKIYIDGSNSSIETKMAIIDHPVFFTNWENTYEPEISPDGKYILFHERPNIKIVDTETMEVVSEVSTSVEHIMDMAFTNDSKRVCLTYWFYNTTFDIIYLDGEDSYLENTINVPYGEGGMAVEFNNIDSKFYIAKKYDIWVVDPETAVIEDTIDLNVSDFQVQIGIDPQGNPIVNTPKYFYYDDKEYFLKEPSRRFTVDYESHRCIIPSPGPDRIYVLDLLTTDMHELPVSKADPDVHIYPNPTHDKLTIKSGKLIDRIEIFTSRGEKLMDKRFRNAATTLNMSGYPEGVYFVKIHHGNDNVSKKIVVAR